MRSSPTALSLVLLFCSPLAWLGPSAGAQTLLHSSQGDSYGARAGNAAAGIGDVDGDGYRDVVVAARGDGVSLQKHGSVSVRSGPTGQVLYTLTPTTSVVNFGADVAGLGDLNGDGVGDFAVSSDSTAGMVWAYSGADGALIWNTGGPPGYGHFGTQIENMGDLDGDGRDDLAVSAVSSTVPGLGPAAFLYSGATGGLMRTLDFSSGGSDQGRWLRNVGDFDGDGHGDLGTGASIDPFFHYTDRVLVRSSATGQELLRIDRPGGPDAIGRNFDGVPDLNGDGVPELVLGVQGSLALRPAQVVDGSSGATLFFFRDPNPLQFFGGPATCVGDVNGDGVADIAIGTREGGAINRLGLYSSTNGRLIFRAEPPSAQFAFNLVSDEIGDINGDGIDDVFYGDPSYREGQIALMGRALFYTHDGASGGVTCLGAANSTGGRAQLTASSVSRFRAAANDLDLDITGLSSGSPGYFLVSGGQGIALQAGGSDGTLCIGALSMGRFAGDIVVADASGTLAYRPDLSALPMADSQGVSVHQVVAGETWNFQLWYRDIDPVHGSSSNFSDAVTVTFR